MSGMATGPHLHYEILVNSVQVNPLKVKMAQGRQLAARLLGRFPKENGKMSTPWLQCRAGDQGGGQTPPISDRRRRNDPPLGGSFRPRRGWRSQPRERTQFLVKEVGWAGQARPWRVVRTSARHWARCGWVCSSTTSPSGSGHAQSQYFRHERSDLGAAENSPPPPPVCRSTDPACSGG